MTAKIINDTIMHGEVRMPLKKKKPAPGGAWSAPALLLPLALLSGCATWLAPPELYANWRYRGIRVDPKTPFRYAPLPNGQEIAVVTLGDGEDAIITLCAAEAEFTQWPRWDLSTQQAREWWALRVREVCVREAFRICRVKTSNSKSTFALMDELVVHGKTVLPNTALLVRCLTPDQFRTWAATVPPSRVDDHVFDEWLKLRQ